jgi:predicted MFS family arabinose efflux permease
VSVCLGILFLAQSLVGVLSFSALDRLIEDLNGDRAGYVARRLQDHIENGLHMGKPLAQFSGLEALLEETRLHAKGVSGIAVFLPEGETLARSGSLIAQAQALRRALLSPDAERLDGARSRLPGTLLQTSGEQTLFSTRLRDADARTQGVLLIQMENDSQAFRHLVAESFRTLLLITLSAAAALAAVFRWLRPSSSLTPGRARFRFLAPLLLLALAQGGYALHVVSTFQEAWLAAMRENVGGISADLARNLDRVLGYGFDLNQLRDIEAPFSRLAKISPIISAIELVDRDGKVLKRADAEGALDANAADAFPRDAPLFRLPLGETLERPEARGALVFHLNEALIASGVRSRVLDAVTVVAVSLVTAIEMFLLSFLLMRRAPPEGRPANAPPAPDEGNPGRLARSILFGFLFAWALPLSFLPLYARTLLVAGGEAPQNLLLALPLTLEMAFALPATLVAGRMADRRGWQTPTFLGLSIFALGMALCAVAGNFVFLSLARSVVGFGYGLTWMGLQGFVVMNTSQAMRGQSMTDLIAGIFAGHLSGAAIGSMLMEQTGPRPVFAVGAVMTLLPLLGIFVLMRPYMNPPPDSRPRPAAPPVPARGPAEGAARFRETLRLLGSRGFGWLLLGSVIPFSVAQVGLLSFALPLYLESAGVQASNVGRVLMVYGLCIVYLGPLVGRGVDRAGIGKKTWVFWGSLLAGASLLGLHAGEGIAGAALSVLALAVAGCCLGASQTHYMLALPEVRSYGAASATSLMRAADKLGQMAGPLIVGALLGVLGMNASLTVTGLLCLAATLPFAFLAPRQACESGKN